MSTPLLVSRHGVDLSTNVGPIALHAPVLTAAGTSGHGAELAAYFDIAQLGAVTVKSLCVASWKGNPTPRVRPLPGAMLNSVGLQGPGIAAFLEDDLPGLVAAGASVVISIWGRRVEDYAQAAAMLHDLPPAVVAVEVNVSCPNLEDRRKMFAHSPTATAEVIAASTCGTPLLAKLSPNVADITEIAGAALSAGAVGLTLVNTLLAMEIDIETRRPSLGAGGGGMSGPALHPVAVRAVYDCRAAFPEAGIIGAGGVRTGREGIELMMAGANAVAVGTATFADPTASLRVLDEMAEWCAKKGINRITEIVGGAHG